MKNVNFHKLDGIDELATPNDYYKISLESPALKVFTDFKYVKPFTIDSSITAFETEKLMLKTHVKLKFIVDENNHFLGIVDLFNLNKQNMIIKVSNGEKIQDLNICEFMIPRDELKAIEYSELKNLTIHDVINALHEKGEQHCLVFESKKHRIRGIISTSDIARKLHMPLEIKNKISFIDIFNTIN